MVMSCITFMKTKQFMAGLVVVAAGLFLAQPLLTWAQSSSLWFLSNNRVRPNVSTWGLQVPQLTSCTGDIETDANGVFSCGTDDTGVAGLTNYNAWSQAISGTSATSGLLYFGGGFVSQASSTVAGRLSVDSLTASSSATSTFVGDILLRQASTTATSTLAGLEITTGGLRVRNLTSCNTVDTDSTGNLKCGTDETSVGGTFEYDWKQTLLGGTNYLQPTTTITVSLNNGFVSQASSTIVGPLNFGTAFSTSTGALDHSLLLQTDETTDTNAFLLGLKYDTVLNPYAKANIAYVNGTNTPMVWLTVHDALSAGNNHFHWSVETKNRTDNQLQSRLEVDHTCDSTECEVSTASGASLRVGSGGDLKIVDGNIVNQDAVVDICNSNQETNCFRFSTTSTDVPIISASGGNTLRIGDDVDIRGTSGLLTIYNTNASSTMRVTGEAADDYRGGYFEYGGVPNVAILGTHDTADSSANSDIPQISLARAGGISFLQNILSPVRVTSTATSTFAGGVRITGGLSTTQGIEGQYFTSSSTATSTLAGGLSAQRINTTATSTMTGLIIGTQGLQVTNLASCNTVDTDSAGNLKCGTDEGGAGGLTSYDAWDHTVANTSATSTLLHFGGGFVSQASSTVTGRLSVDYLTASSTATSTLTGGLLAQRLNTTATSTLAGLIIGTQGLQVSNLVSCDTVDTDSAGNFKCGTDNADGGNATTLDSIDSGSFLRSDTSDSYTSGTLTFDAATTLDVNGNLSIADTAILLDGASTELTATGNLTFNTDDLVIIKSSGNVGVASSSPTSLFSVHGNSYFGSGVGSQSIFDNGTIIFPISATNTIPARINAWSIATSTTATPIISIDGEVGGCDGCTDIVLPGGINLKAAQYKMATSSGNLATGNGIFNDIYTAPTGRRAMITGWTIAGSANAVSGHVKSGGSYYRVTATSTIISTSQAQATTVFVLEPGESFSLFASATGMTAWVSLIEYAASVPVYSSKLLDPGAGTTTLYTVPSGKSAYLLSSDFATLNSTAVLNHTNWSGATVSASWSIAPKGAGPIGIAPTANLTNGSRSSRAFTIPMFNSTDAVVVNLSAGTAGQMMWVTVVEN